MTIDELLSSLEGVRRSGSGHVARCPAHDDRNPSLSIAPGDDGRILLHCHAGCSFEDVVAALRLRAGDLFERRNGTGTSTRTRGENRGSGTQQSTSDPLAWLAAYCSVPIDHVRRLPVEAWADGRIAFTFGQGMSSKVRVAGQKAFTWEPAGGTISVLWPTPTSALPERVWFNEGESDCVVARYLGLDAYAVTRGADTPLSQAAVQVLRRRGVQQAVIVFDSDRVGREGAAKLAAVFSEHGIQAVVVDLVASGLLDPLSGGKDLRDCWAAFRARGEAPETLRSQLEAAASASSFEADETPEPPNPAVTPWPRMEPEAYHGLAGDIVQAFDPHTEADPVAILLSFLVAFSNAIGNGPHCKVGAERHELRLWATMVGNTSKGRKGSSWAPVQALMEVAAPEWVRDHLTSGLSSGEGLIWAVRDPIHRREKVKDGKEYVYQDVEVDPGVADKRALVLETEFASPLKLMVREGNILSTVLRQAWDHGTLRTLVKTTPARATGAHICILGHVVAEELRRYLVESEAAGGFGNRFLWACVRRSKALAEGGALQQATIDAAAERVRSAVESARYVQRMERDTAARRLWGDVYPTLSEGRPGLAGAVCARSEAQVLRLSAIYALLDESPIIRAPHLLAALAVWDYCEASAAWVFGAKLGDPVADTILTALREKGRLTRTEISGLFGRHTPAAAMQRALEHLVSLGLAECSRDDTTGGRHAEVWRPVR